MNEKTKKYTDDYLNKLRNNPSLTGFLPWEREAYMRLGAAKEAIAAAGGKAEGYVHYTCPVCGQKATAEKKNAADGSYVVQHICPTCYLVADTETKQQLEEMRQNDERPK